MFPIIVSIIEVTHRHTRQNTDVIRGISISHVPEDESYRGTTGTNSSSSVKHISTVHYLVPTTYATNQQQNNISIIGDVVSAPVSSVPTTTMASSNLSDCTVIGVNLETLYTTSVIDLSI